MSRPLRVSAVSFLNARPLVEGLAEDRGLIELEFDLPAACADRLHSGEVDLGLIPAIEYLHGDYRLVPDVAIASDGPIRSVAVFTTVPVARIRRLALDRSSRTSVALTRILSAKLWSIAPSTIPLAPDLSRMLAEADAALLIGDPALELDPLPPGVEKLDLGEAWQALTGLPFVYAAWAGRPEGASPAHVAALIAARDRGVRRLDAIAAAAAGGAGARQQRFAQYLRDNLRYTLGAREQAGLERFFALAAEVGAAPALRPLRFYR
jgi:chorismate dehydratase